MTEQESLKLITEMIGKAKFRFHESGTSALLWGSVVAVCGLVSFSERYWHWSLPFDIWLLTFIAVLPQVIISIRENRRKKVVTYKEEAINAIWMVFAISVFALVFYVNMAPYITEKLAAQQGNSIMFISASGKTRPFHYYVPSNTSLFILLYAMPTLATGIAGKFKPMLVGGISCYCLFIVSCFTPDVYDLLLAGVAGIVNWLIPGIMLRKRYLNQKRAMNV